MAIEWETGSETAYCHVCGTVETCADPRECEDEANAAIWAERETAIAVAPVPCFLCNTHKAETIFPDYRDDVARPVCLSCYVILDC